VRGFTVLSRNAKDMNALEANWMNPLGAVPQNVPSA